ncbi:MAG TPA: substrate-binding domain-containing protein [Solirubrobacteraceae bacterium]|jgi:ABC-type phosphate transport system substrate-binding protein|nr:substrate-binding domain-containing protein [Solirubrobacteraceae bacterium]
MTSKRRLPVTLVAAVVSALALIALSGVAAGSASAAACMHVAPGETGAWEKRNAATGACEKALAGGSYVKVEEEKGMEVAPGVFCFKVAAGEKGAWKDAKCSAAEAGGPFIKVSTVCTNSTAFSGQGSSLQKLAQLEYWIPGSGCNGSYSSTGSAAGLKAFGVGTKVMGTNQFIGTDDAPSGTCTTLQLKEMEEAAKGVCVGPPVERQDLVIPVAQAAIAVLVNPPENCEISEIGSADLENVWNGKILKWKEIATAKDATGHAGACEKNITRYVRKDGSGTTYQFKHYLFEINKLALEGTEKNGTFAKRKWTELQEEPERNKEWPEKETSKPALKLSPVFPAEKEGGGGEVEEVKKEKQGTKEGSFGYAALGDAKAQFPGTGTESRYKWLKVEREKTSFVFPGEGSEPTKNETTSNCAETSYSNIAGLKAEADVDWSEVYGGHVKAINYPICTLTWDVGLVNYTLAGFTAAQGEATKQYLEYVVSKTGGQKAFEKHNYREVEEAVGTLAVETAKLVGSK